MMSVFAYESTERFRHSACIIYISASHPYPSLVSCTTVSGTSASAPVMAGFVALVNSARLAAGKAPLGKLVHLSVRRLM
jgi:hypothetical protein